MASEVTASRDIITYSFMGYSANVREHHGGRHGDYCRDPFPRKQQGPRPRVQCLGSLV